MDTFLEKGFFLGLGAYTLTKEKAEKIIDELIEKGRISREDSPKLLNELVKRADEERKDFEKKIDSVLEKSVKRLGIPTQKDIDTINAKLDEILKHLTNQ